VEKFKLSVPFVSDTENPPESTSLKILNSIEGNTTVFDPNVKVTGEKTLNLIPLRTLDGVGISGNSKVNVNGVSGALKDVDGVMELYVSENV
jgi:hypothetical protein